jgi:hypothetical protein
MLLLVDPSRQHVCIFVCLVDLISAHDRRRQPLDLFYAPPRPAAKCRPSLNVLRFFNPNFST